VALFEWIDYMGKWDERYLNIFAIPNGGQRHALVAGKLKQEGVRAGVPDIFVAIPVFDDNPCYGGLFIEMKIKPNKVSPLQHAWLDRLAKHWYKVEVCWSFEEAQQAILSYLGRQR